MPHLEQVGQLKIPWGGRSPRSRSSSLSGARICRAGSQAARLLVAYLTYGPSTDLQQAERLGLPESRISARRGGLAARHEVAWVADVIGPFGATNGKYGLTAVGRVKAEVLARS